VIDRHWAGVVEVGKRAALSVDLAYLAYDVHVVVVRAGDEES